MFPVSKLSTAADFVIGQHPAVSEEVTEGTGMTQEACVCVCVVCVYSNARYFDLSAVLVCDGPVSYTHLTLPTRRTV